jgi:mannose-6-phosphate isomerase-like protein (cupin superfamily)
METEPGQPAKPPLGLIHRHCGDPSRVRRLGPYVLESLIDPQEEGAGTFYRVTIGPHQQTGVSFHGLAEEYYYVLSGRGKAILDGRPYALAAGDFLRLPPGTTHGFVTDDEPLEMLDIHTPGSRPDRDVYFVSGPPPEGFGGARL